MTDEQETNHAFARSLSNVELDTEIGVVAAFFAELQTKQEPLGPDFEKVLYENLWDLYES